jgi:hypothetical protein
MMNTESLDHAVRIDDYISTIEKCIAISGGDFNVDITVGRKNLDICIGDLGLDTLTNYVGTLNNLLSVFLSLKHEHGNAPIGINRIQ